MKPDRQSTDDWQCNGWDDAVKSRRELSEAMTFRERLLWLERAMAFARKLQQAPIVAPPTLADHGAIVVAEDQGPYSTGKERRESE